MYLELYPVRRTGCGELHTGCGMPDPVHRTGCGSQSAQDVVAGCTGYDNYILICVLCTGYGYHVAVTVHHGGMTLPRKPGRLP